MGRILAIVIAALLALALAGSVFGGLLAFARLFLWALLIGIAVAAVVRWLSRRPRR